MIDRSQIAAVILAGGKASRLHQVDKALLPLNGRALIEHVVARVSAECGEILISVNRNREKYEYLGLALIADYRDPFAGPLIGIASAMRALQHGSHMTELKYLACYLMTIFRFSQH